MQSARSPPVMNEVAMDGRTCYDQALNLHKYATQRRKAPQREELDRIQIIRNKKVFDSTVNSLELFHQQKQVTAMRNHFAWKEFAVKALPFFFFLICISIGKFQFFSQAENFF